MAFVLNRAEREYKQANESAVRSDIERVINQLQVRVEGIRTLQDAVNSRGVIRESFLSVHPSVKTYGT